VFAGSQAAAMARAVMESGQRRLVHLFDSFQGIPQAGPRDPEFLEAKHKPGLSTCSIEQVQQHMAEWAIDPSILRYHPGWFEDTLPGDVGAIAVLRLDADLYESTKVAMERLYPKLSVGGWCIIDDFGLQGCREAVMEILTPGPIYFQRH
jgi:O-methyltransferase